MLNINDRKGTCFGVVDYHVNPVVMIASVFIIWFFVLWCGLDPNALETMGDVNTFANYYFGWFYVSALLVFGFFAVYLVFSRFGDIKLGAPDKEPKYSVMTWFSMLFSAGVGVGLYFYGVAEPISHFTSAEGGSTRWSSGQYVDHVPIRCMFYHSLYHQPHCESGSTRLPRMR